MNLQNGNYFFPISAPCFDVCTPVQVLWDVNVKGVEVAEHMYMVWSKGVPIIMLLKNSAII